MEHDDMTDKPDMCASLRKWADRLRDENATMAAELAGYADAWEAERAALMPCGHHQSLMMKSAETGADPYCDLCAAKSGGLDAEQMEAELRARIAEQDEEIEKLRLQLAAGGVAALGPDADGWIENKGDRPAAPDVRVDVLFRNAVIIYGEDANSWSWHLGEWII